MPVHRRARHPGPASGRAPISKRPCRSCRALWDFPFWTISWDHHILRHYREAGFVIPEGVKAVWIVRGRPYINVTLFQSFMVQLGGDPRDVPEQMGGQGGLPPAGVERLPWWTRLWVGGLFMWKMRQAARQAPAWFAEMKRMATDLHADSLKGLSLAELLARMDRIGTRLREHDLTFAIVAGVGQTLRTLGLLSSRAIGEGWRGLLNASLQGQGTIISARQVLWLAELANEARREDRARAFFLTDPWTPNGFRSALADTRFLEEFDRFLAEFGHRAIGESDVATPRFSENPDYLLGVIRAHLQATGGKSVEEIQQRQESARGSSSKGHPPTNGMASPLLDGVSMVVPATLPIPLLARGEPPPSHVFFRRHPTSGLGAGRTALGNQRTGHPTRHFLSHRRRDQSHRAGSFARLEKVDRQTAGGTGGACGAPGAGHDTR
ncbi:MAG: hypothetical protein KatS3mg082_2249 [Nitrospiraceae bacterium]|nr:MAG: hypothetical protein KatS3mg082_2249 [Nitrospiraceae bacterium]